jgi:hypothetical protein
MGAMIMFSLLTLNVSRSMVMNTKELSKSEIEYNGIALAHSYLERAQWATEDELTRSHSDFIFESTGKPTGCDFTKNNPCIETLELGRSDSLEVEYYVYVKIEDDVPTPRVTDDNKKVTVGVTSPYFYEQYDDTFSEYPIEMDFINSF